MIRVLSINCFRGIPQNLDIDLMTKNGRSPASTLLLGDNGTGKSSISDAFEFVLRGKVSRRGNAGAKTRYESKNLLVGGNPSVQVTLEDGRQFLRGAAPKDFAGIQLKRQDIVEGFSLTPVVISRADIDVFWQVTGPDRMRFFFDYLRDSGQHAGHAALEIERVEAQINSSRVDLLEAQIALAKVSKQPADQIPVDKRADFYEWRGRTYPQYGTGTHSYGISDPKRMRKINQVPLQIRSAISDLAQKIESIHKLKTHLEAMRSKFGTEGHAPSVISAGLPAILNEISEDVSADFAAIAKLGHVEAISLRPSASGYEFEVACRLSSGEDVQPADILSEASLDLLALLILLGVMRACVSRGQAKFVVLDDVWQSVDSIYRVRILQYIFSDRFKGWQLFITVHDRLWARVIEETARKQAFPMKSLEIVDWSPQKGPRLLDANFDTAAQLAILIEAAPAPEVLAGYTGRSLEELSQRLSISLRTSVERKFGDRYTLEDLWPGIYKRINRADTDASLKEVASQVNATYMQRNLYGSHYATWAESLSRAEVQDFANYVLGLWARVHCPICGRIISRRPGGENIIWPCGHTGADPS